MTKIANNPVSKRSRRISAAERLEKLIERYEAFLETNEQILFVGNLAFNRQQMEYKLRSAKAELIVLKERIAKPGNLRTKKNRTNTSWRSA